MFKKSMIVVLILLCCMAISGVCLSDEDSNVLKITAKQLSYANLYKQIDIPLNAENITLEYYVKVASTAMEAYSCGLAVHFWWDIADKGVAIKVDSVYADKPGRLRFFNPQNSSMSLHGYTPDNLPVPIYSRVWYGYKVQLDSEKIRFYIREIEGDWVELELATVDRDSTISLPPDGLIIGIGGPMESGYGPNPRFRNSINDQTRLENSKARSMLFDNIVVTVDGKVVFTETFERNIDELETDWNLAADPTNEGTVFEVISEPGNRPLPTIIEFSM